MRSPLIAENYGDFLSISKNNIVLKNKNLVESTPIKELSHIIIKGHSVSLSTAFVLKCLNNNLPIILLDDFWKPYSVITKSGKASRLSALQLKFVNGNKGARFIGNLLKEKARKQHQVLHYHIRSLRLNSNNEVKNIEAYNFKNFLNSFDVLVKQKSSVEKMRQQFFLLEARSSRAYWKVISKLLRSVNFPGRQKRNSMDPFNKLLNYGYALLSSTIFKTSVLAGLDLSIPLLHHRKGVAFPFVFDLMEPFRPITDHIALSFLHKQKKQIFNKHKEIRTSVLKRYREFWFKEMNETQPWLKSNKSTNNLIIKLVDKYKNYLNIKS